MDINLVCRTLWRLFLTSAICCLTWLQPFCSLFSKGNSLFVLYGILTLTLCGGDAFHLVPRVIRAFRGSSDKIKKQLGMGLQISSVTMTVFYILLMYIWKNTFPEMQIPAALEIIIWVSALVRIIVCLLPQNRWCSGNGNQKAVHYPQHGICRNRCRRYYSVCLVRQCPRLSPDPYGSCHSHFLRLLSSGYLDE